MNFMMKIYLTQMNKWFINIRCFKNKNEKTGSYKEAMANWCNLYIHRWE